MPIKLKKVSTLDSDNIDLETISSVAAETIALKNSIDNILTSVPEGVERKPEIQAAFDKASAAVLDGRAKLKTMTEAMKADLGTAATTAQTAFTNAEAAFNANNFVDALEQTFEVQRNWGVVDGLLKLFTASDVRIEASQVVGDARAAAVQVVSMQNNIIDTLLSRATSQRQAAENARKGLNMDGVVKADREAQSVLAQLSEVQKKLLEKKGENEPVVQKATEAKGKAVVATYHTRQQISLTTSLHNVNGRLGNLQTAFDSWPENADSLFVNNPIFAALRDSAKAQYSQASELFQTALKDPLPENAFKTLQRCRDLVNLFNSKVSDIQTRVKQMSKDVVTEFNDMRESGKSFFFLTQNEGVRQLFTQFLDLLDDGQLQLNQPIFQTTTPLTWTSVKDLYDASVSVQHLSKEAVKTFVKALSKESLDDVLTFKSGMSQQPDVRDSTDPFVFPLRVAQQKAESAQKAAEEAGVAKTIFKAAEMKQLSEELLQEAEAQMNVFQGALQDRVNQFRARVQDESMVTRARDILTEVTAYRKNLAYRPYVKEQAEKVLTYMNSAKMTVNNLPDNPSLQDLNDATVDVNNQIQVATIALSEAQRTRSLLSSLDFTIRYYQKYLAYDTSQFTDLGDLAPLVEAAQKELSRVATTGSESKLSSQILAIVDQVNQKVNLVNTKVFESGPILRAKLDELEQNPLVQSNPTMKQVLEKMNESSSDLYSITVEHYANLEQLLSKNKSADRILKTFDTLNADVEKFSNNVSIMNQFSQAINAPNALLQFARERLNTMNVKTKAAREVNNQVTAFETLLSSLDKMVQNSFADVTSDQAVSAWITPAQLGSIQTMMQTGVMDLSVNAADIVSPLTFHAQTLVFEVMKLQMNQKFNEAEESRKALAQNVSNLDRKLNAEDVKDSDKTAAMEAFKNFKLKVEALSETVNLILKNKKGALMCQQYQ